MTFPGYSLGRARSFARWPAVPDPPKNVEFSPDGRTLASGIDDHTAMLWNTDRDVTAAQLCAIVARNLTREEWELLIPGEPYRPICEKVVPQTATE